MTCCHPLRKAADDLAHQSVKTTGWEMAYVEAQKARGHSPARGRHALANRWLHILWKTGVPYDELIYVANRSRQGRALAA